MAEMRVTIDGTYNNVPIPVTGTVTIAPGGSATPSPTLTAVTTGTGTSVDFNTARQNISMAILVNGTVTGGVVVLDVSQDGTNWVMFSVSSALATGVNQKLTASNEAWRYARGRVTTNVTGGGTITCTLMSGA